MRTKYQTKNIEVKALAYNGKNSEKIASFTNNLITEKLAKKMYVGEYAVSYKDAPKKNDDIILLSKDTFKRLFKQVR